MTLKRSISALTLLLLAVGLVACGGDQARPDRATADTITAASTSTVSLSNLQGVKNEIETIPLYPDAKQKDHANPWAPGLQVVVYETSATSTEVLTFYKDALPANGWRLIKEQVDPPAVLQFLPTTASDDLPWKLHLSVIPTVLRSSNTEVRIILKRQPDPTRVPLYPDANQIEVKYAQPSRFVVRITTYVTNAKPDEIKAYYEETLPQHGWELVEPIEGQGPAFAHRYTGGWSSVRVNSATQPDGRVRVELRVTNTDMQMP